jgi:3-oxo-5-alpha-steroid 4-dehydrogenase 1
MCGTNQTAAGKAQVEANKSKENQRESATLKVNEPSAWSLASISALVVMNVTLILYLSRVVPAIQGPNRWIVQGLMAYISCLAVSQLLEKLGTGSGTNYGKFAAGATQERRSAYARLMDFLAGPTLPVSISWWTMEQPSFWVPFAFQVLSISQQGLHSGNIFLSMMLVHYAQRSFVFPFLSNGRPFPVLYWFLAFVFCTVNGTMQSLDLLYGGHFGASSDPLAEAKSPRALLGMLLFAFGMYTNVRSDQILRNLRKPGERGYKIPCGGMFEYISGANLWGECVEWLGFALACGNSPTAWCFSIFNWVGIGGRAVATHDWYVKKFGEEYEKLQRRRLVPWVW